VNGYEAHLADVLGHMASLCRQLMEACRSPRRVATQRRGWAAARRRLEEGIEDGRRLLEQLYVLGAQVSDYESKLGEKPPCKRWSTNDARDPHIYNQLKTRKKTLRQIRDEVNAKQGWYPLETDQAVRRPANGTPSATTCLGQSETWLVLNKS